MPEHGRSSRRNLFLLGYFLVIISSCYPQQLNVETVRNSKEMVVAVYEHRPLGDPRSDTPLQLMRKNTQVYKKVAEKAAQSGAELLVFPEYGTYATSSYYSRDTLLPYLQQIPTTWSPCQKNDISGSEIFQDLSCIAKSSNITIVANIGTVIPCTSVTHLHCPEDGRFQYNTNVVFNREGLLTGVYYKHNLFGERTFNQPPMEHVTFGMAFGEVGVAICFDLLFKQPAAGLVEEVGVDLVALPTYWFNRIPFLAMYEYAEAWAVRMKTHLLVANLHMPESAHVGSGVFGPDGVVNYTYVPQHGSGGQLVIAKIRRNADVKAKFIGDREPRNDDGPSESVMFESENFRAVTNGDPFSYVKIPTGKGAIRVCNNGLCCHLQYNLKSQPTTVGNEFFGLGAFSGVHKENYTLCNEVCGVVRCVITDHGATICGDGISRGGLGFSELHLQGNFTDGTYRFPTVLMDNARLAPSGAWKFDERNGLRLMSTSDLQLLVFGIYGRCFYR